MPDFGINITGKALEKALSHINEYKSAHPEDKGVYRIRIEVLGGGCAGFQYNFSLDKDLKKDDITFKKGNKDSGELEIVVSELSLMYLQDITIDYSEGLTKAGFEIINPNATGGCGCGNSFSV